MPRVRDVRPATLELSTDDTNADGEEQAVREGAHMSAIPQRETPGSLPTGTVTFVFTDIEGSARRWDRDRAAMEQAVRRHDELVRTAIVEHGGHIFKTMGDEFCAAFTRPEDAIAAILEREFTETTTHDRLTTLLREGLSPDELARLTARGAGLEPGAAIALALQES